MYLFSISSTPADCHVSQFSNRDFFVRVPPPPLVLAVSVLVVSLPIAATQFSNRDEADLCLAAAIGATDPALARDSGGSCVYLGTRALHITRAVDREQVRWGYSATPKSLLEPCPVTTD